MQAKDQPQPKRRGRPKGTGFDDEPFLRAIADRRVVAPHTALRTVIRTVVAERLAASPDAARNAQPDSIIHRLAAKWRCDGPRHLEAAAARRLALQIEALVQGAAAIQRGVEDLAIRAAPYVQAMASSFEATLRKPEVQKVLALMARFQQAAQRDPFLAKVDAMKRDPRMAKWMSGPLQGERLGR
jgi:hypothetical protein